jgi:tRNA pseudouridine13 synthase
MPDFSEVDIEGVEILKTVRHIKKLRRGEHTGNRFKLVVRGMTADATPLETRLQTLAAEGFPNYFGKQRFGHDGQNLKKACELITDTEKQLRRKLDRKQKDIYLSALRSWLFNESLSKRVSNGDWQCDDTLWVHGLSPHRDITLPDVPPAHAEAAAYIERMGIKAHERPMRVIPGHMTWQLEGDTLTLAFDLPVGAYATTLLEELLEIEEGQP